MLTLEEISSLMLASRISPEVQLTQTGYRQGLVDHWHVKEGWHILEIGCGQGDTTAVLADAVGTSGRVTAVDLAPPTYGAPVTLGESANHLRNGVLGDRVEFHFAFDIMSSNASFSDDEFDAIVLANCTWYFESFEKLGVTLQRIRPWSSRLFLSEWDLMPRSIHQFGHFLSVLIQGQMEMLRPDSEANVRTPYAREQLTVLLKRTGWNVVSESEMDTIALDDARWEVDSCLAQGQNVVEAMDPIDNARNLIEGQLDVLRRLGSASNIEPLPAYSIVAARAHPEA